MVENGKRIARIGPDAVLCRAPRLGYTTVLPRRTVSYCTAVMYTGRSAVRLAHLLWEQGVAGSNPAAPTIFFS